MISKINALTFDAYGKSCRLQSYKYDYLIDLIGLLVVKATDLKLVAPCIFGRIAPTLFIFEGGASFSSLIIRICNHKFVKFSKLVFEFAFIPMRMGSGLGGREFSLNLKKSFSDACRIGFGGAV